MTITIQQILLAAVFLACAAVLPLNAHAQYSQDPMKAAIWASLLADPRSASIPPAQMQAVVDALAQKAQEQHMSAQDIIASANTISPQGAATTAFSPVTCEGGIMGYLCVFNTIFGFSGDSYIVPLTLLVTSGLLIVVIWEMIIHHRKKLAALTASAPPWENMPK